ncbi:hypothetical protein CTI12_AA202150 [Artemisia annua]|uniref:Uncharacterized protein n=1 Tax=Artemisia annua TaxID=35608 RepID=A0A2U1P223_ARTAN|nr:hypothetical protein CTI12_AA202150 [Artemisia annua]
MRGSAMTNLLVNVGTVEGGDLVKRALSALIRPSSHQQRWRTSFKRIKSDGTVEGGDLVKPALSALIRPSSHQQRWRTSFKRIKSDGYQ